MYELCGDVKLVQIGGSVIADFVESDQNWDSLEMLD